MDVPDIRTQQSSGQSYERLNLDKSFAVRLLPILSLHRKSRVVPIDSWYRSAQEASHIPKGHRIRGAFSDIGRESVNEKVRMVLKILFIKR